MWRRATVSLAFLTLVLLGMRLQFNHTISVGYVAAGILAPMWLPKLKKYRGAVPLLLVGVIAVISGFWLLGWNSASHQLNQNSLFNNSVLLVGLLLSIAVVVWARQLMPVWVIGLAYGTGLLLGVSRDGMAAENPWKYGYSIPVIVLALSLCGYAAIRFRQHRGYVEIGVLLALAVMSGLHDSRSLFAMLGLALILVAWQLIPVGRTRRRSVTKTVLAFVMLVLITYEGGTSLLVDGYLGEAAQQRSVEQINLTGSLLLGARPEMAASYALFQSHPWGFGVGVMPSLEDVAVAKTGMAAINYQPNNGYVERYMFGTHFELHSVTADLWVLFGIPGLILAAAVLLVTVRWIIVSITHRRASSLVLFLCINSLWNVFFSPLYTSITSMALTVGLAVLPRVLPSPGGEIKTSTAMYEGD